MNYRSYASIRAGDGAPLSEILPLGTPLSLQIDPSNICNFRCVFCPTGDDELLRSSARPKGLMSFELFRKIIDDLAGFRQPVKVLHLYKDGEPLVNKALPQMVAYAKASGRVERVETTTNGSLLTAVRGKQLIEAGLDGIRISVYAMSDRGYRDLARAKTGVESVRSNVAGLFALKSKLGSRLHIHCKILDAGLSDRDKDLFLSTFAAISDSVHVESIMGWSDTPGRDLTLGLVPDRGSQGEALNPKRVACSEPFMKLAVNFNGEVSVCCVDWAHQLVVGDLRREALADIWNGTLLRELRLKHLTGRRHELQACASCHYIYGLPARSNFDHIADRLVPEYTG